jgi:polysaccharide chain length determinant protein (PEP-CTERM system associated)
MSGMRQLTFDDYLDILRRRWWLVMILALVGAGAGYGLAHFLPKRYTSQTLVLVEQPTVPGDYVKPVITQDVNQRLATMQQQILSRTRLEPVIQQFGLFSKEIKEVSMEDLVERLREAISVTPIRAMSGTEGRQLPGFYISVVFDDAHLAQQICSTITSMFMEENLKLRQQLSEQTTQFLSKQLEDAKTRLDEQDAKLAVFKRQHIGSLPDESNTNLNILTGLTSQLEAVTQALGRAQQDKTYAESVLAQQLDAWKSSQAGQNPETLQQQLTARELQLSELLSKYTDDHPDVIKAKNDIEVLKKKIADSETKDDASEPDKAAKTQVEPPQIQGLRAQIFQMNQSIKERAAQQEELQRQIKLYQSRVESSPSIEQDYKQLTRDYQTALAFYNDLLIKRDQSAMANDLERHQQGEQFQVLDPANLPDKPSFPDKMLFSLGGSGAGLTLAIGLILIVEMRDTSLRSGRSVELALRLPVLAMIPSIEAVASKKPKQKNHTLTSVMET